MSRHMTTATTIMPWVLLLALVAGAFSALAASPRAGEPAEPAASNKPGDKLTAAQTVPSNIGARRELFADDSLIQRLAGHAELRLHAVKVMTDIAEPN